MPSRAPSTRGRRGPSSILNAYLLVSLLLDGAVLRTFWLSGLAGSVRAVSTASFAVKACLLVLEANEKAGLIGRSGEP